MKPQHIDGVCANTYCRAKLVPYDTIMRGHASNPEEWVCPNCVDRVYLNLPGFTGLLRSAEEEWRQINAGEGDDE